MAKTSVLNRLLPDAKLPRNVFDRSCVVNQSQMAGQIMPVFCEAFPQGSYVKLNRQVFSRSAAVNTAAFATLDQHVEFYAVPISYLWSYWDNFKLKINDYNSSALPIFSSGGFVGYNPNSVPYFDIDEFLNLDLSNWASQYHYDQLGFLYAEGAMRLFEAFGYPIDNKSAGGTGAVPCVCNLLKCAAYQKVYYDHKRNSMYEVNNPFAYNLDWISVESSSNNNKIDFTDSNHKARFFELTKLRYVDWRKDYYKNIYPSLNYSSNMDSVGGFTIPSSVLTHFNSTRTVSPLADTSQVGILAPVAGTPSSIVTSISGIRAAFALDKLLRHISYAPKHVKEQIEARYGVKANSKQSFESVRIGQFMNDIVIGEVTSMANTESSGTGDKLGAIGGKGIGHGEFGNDIEYTCDSDSIIVGICYFLPRTSYDAKGIDNWNMKLTPEDFFQPEYMDLGLQPLYRKEINRVANAGDNNIMGYMPRYQEYKLGRDKNLGAFKAATGVFVNSGGIVHSSNTGALTDFVVHTNNDINWSVVTAADLTYFKVNPACLNSIFVQSAASSMLPNDDQFYYNMIIKCFSNQNMSVHGQPSF